MTELERLAALQRELNERTAVRREAAAEAGPLPALGWRWRLRHPLRYLAIYEYVPMWILSRWVDWRERRR